MRAMTSSYATDYVTALLGAAAVSLPTTAGRNVGEIAPTRAVQPHIALFLELGEQLYLGTTAGVAARPMPLPVSTGFQYFELCALTERHSPRVLWLLSNVASYMLAVSSPFFHGTDEMRAAWARTATLPEPVPFLPYQTIRLGGDDTRFLLVPRWKFVVPMGPPVEVVEPLPITPVQWAELAGVSLDQRGRWAASLGLRSRSQWDPLIDLP